MNTLDSEIRNGFFGKIEEALLLSTSDPSSNFSLYDIWEYHKKTVPETHQEHYRYFEDLFYDKLKIIGGAFSVLEKFSNIPLLLFRKDRNHSIDVTESDFFWLPYEIKHYGKQAATLIDITFLSTRESQRLDELGPDFLRYINAILRNELYQFKALTNGETMHNGLPLIYCDSAEIIIFCFCYILVLEKYQIAKCNSGQIFSENHIETLSFDSIEGKGILDFILTMNQNSFFNEFFIKIGELPVTFFKRINMPINSSIENIKEELEKFIKKGFKITNFTNYDESLGLIHKYARFPIIPYLLIYWYKEDKKGKCQNPIFPCHLVFPVWNSYSFKPQILVENKIVPENKVIFALLTVDDNFYFNLKDNTNNNFSILSRIIHKLGYITSDTVFYNKFAKKSIQKQAIRSAISQVMARNMSHNIGSHVMNKLIDAVYLENYSANKENLKSYLPSLDLTDEKDHTSFRQISVFNNYVKCRMDYLSDMSFGTPLMQTSKKMYGEVFKELDKVRLLLENISGLGDNFKYSINLELKNENGVCIPINDENDFALAIPNDILGSQAFYNIFENIIRNTAKHAAKIKDKETIFTIRFSEIADNDIEKLKTIDKEEAQGWMCIEIYDSLFPDNIDKLLNDLNEKINTPILTENNQLRSNALGIIEMEASAAYLRKLDSYTIDDDCYKVENDTRFYNNQGKMNVLKAVAIKDMEDSHLGYRFFMLKSQEILLVTDDIVEEEKAKLLKKSGVWVVCTERFITHLNSGKVYNHQIVVHDGKKEGVKSAIENHKTSLPIRILEVITIAEWLDYDAAKIIECCWCKWSDILPLEYGIRFPQFPIKDTKIAKFFNHADGLDVELNNDTNFYCDGLSSLAQGKLPGFKTNLEAYKNSISGDVTNKTKLGESIISKVLVIDERIQSDCSKTYIQKEITFKRLYEKTGIIVPDKNEAKLNLSATTIDKDIFENEDGFILKTIKTFKMNSDYVLIHFSLLERAFKNEPDRGAAINSYLNTIAEKANIVVTTGRGTLKGVTNKVRFINLSAVIYALVDVRSKYLTNYILNSSRKSH